MKSADPGVATGWVLCDTCECGHDRFWHGSDALRPTKSECLAAGCGCHAFRPVKCTECDAPAVAIEKTSTGYLPFCAAHGVRPVEDK